MGTPFKFSDEIFEGDSADGVRLKGGRLLVVPGVGSFRIIDGDDGESAVFDKESVVDIELFGADDDDIDDDGDTDDDDDDDDDCFGNVMEGGAETEAEAEAEEGMVRRGFSRGTRG